MVYHHHHHHVDTAAPLAIQAFWDSLMLQGLMLRWWRSPDPVCPKRAEPELKRKPQLSTRRFCSMAYIEVSKEAD